MPSGQWREGSPEAGFEQIKTAMGHPVSSFVSDQDKAALLPFAWNGESESVIYPPEFKFHPDTGASLDGVLSRSAAGSWAPPHGDTFNPDAAAGLRGLRQTTLNINLSRLDQRSGVDRSDAQLKTPGPGQFEFIVAPAGTRWPVLLALDAGRGLLHVWLPRSQQWRPLTHAQNGLLAECRLLDQRGWRAEVITGSDQTSQLFIPTDEGLACVRLDVPALVFEVNYIGGGAAVGAPMRWANRIWTLIQRAGAALELVGCDDSGQALESVAISGPVPATPLVNMQSPLADSRRAMWLCDGGRVQLKLRTDGSVEAEFLAWPEKLQPSFQFGAPYHANNGDLWQLCWDQDTQHYEYLNLTSRHGEREPAERPLMCTGDVNYRYTQRIDSSPWQVPEQGVDGAAIEHFIPMLESPDQGVVLGVRVEGKGGLGEMLASGEKMSAALVCDSNGAQTAFETIGVRAPWNLRWFVYARHLWAFHVDLPHLMGWELQS